MNVRTTTRLLLVLYSGFALVPLTALSYWLATVGHPTALWFWRDVLGVLS